jgi:Ca2+-binding RTX toxin-like protein
MGVMELLADEHPTQMLDVQAEQFLDQYEIVHHLPNRSSGFSATLMRNKETGEYTLSFRSTEFRDELNGGDGARDGITGADGQIANHGFALGQLMQMEDYYNFLVSSGLISSEQVLDITGYSLGGQLASAFTVMHPEIVNQAYVFNGVGLGDFNEDAGSLQDMINDYRQSLLNESQRLDETLTPDVYDINAVIPLYPTSSSLISVWPFQSTNLPNLHSTSSHLLAATETWQKYSTLGASFIPGQTDTAKNFTDEINAKITQIFGQAAHNDTQIVANQGINSSNEQAVFIEDQPDWVKDGGLLNKGGSFGDTHSIILLLDSLLLTEALQTIDPTLSRSDAEQIYQSISSSSASRITLSAGSAEGDSLEKTLDAFYRLLVDPDAPSSLVSYETGGFGDIELRNAYLEKITELKNKGLTILERGTSITIASFASTSGDEWLTQALDNETGLPFRYAIVELNPFAVISDNSIYDLHDVSAYALYDPVSRTGQLTAEFLQDRLGLLELQNQVNLGDLDPASVNGFDSMQYMENWAGYEPLNLLIDGYDLNFQHIVFDRQSTELTGSGHDDRLYAGEQDNLISGGAGDDYLEGGLGFDTYIYKSGDGFDQIQDIDGLGSIVFDGETLAGGRQLAGGIYQSADGRFTYLLDETSSGTADLVINNSIRILNFQNGDLGIDLQINDDLYNASGYTTVSLNGENFGVERHTMSVFALGSIGNDLLSMASGGSDLVLAGDGNDWLYAGDGADTLLGGSGNDLIMPGKGADIVMAGEGDDLVDPLFVVDKNVTGSLSDEKRFWIDVGQHFTLVTDDKYIRREDTGELTFVTRLEFPAETMSGLSYDGVYNFSYNPSTSSIAYTSISDSDEDFLININSQYLFNEDAASRYIDGGDGNDTLFGNAGADFISAGDGDDRVSAYRGDDVVAGGAGNDRLLGGAGDDLLLGGDDDDWLIGDFGRDRLYGGTGNDVLLGDHDLMSASLCDDDWLYGGDGDDALLGNGGNDRLYGERGRDRLFGGAGNDYLWGGLNHDQLYGDAGNDFLNGGDGGDELLGGEGDDWLEGGGGADSLQGDKGDDHLMGNHGNDLLAGGEGVDTYVFNLGDGVDRIQDLSTGNRLQFGHGISLSDIQILFPDENNRSLIEIHYSENDAIIIEDYVLERWVDVTFADYPENSYAFSKMFGNAKPLPVVNPAAADTSFFWSNADSTSDVAQALQAIDRNPHDSTSTDNRLALFRAGFVESMYRDLYSYYAEVGYFNGSDGGLEILTNRRISHLTGNTEVASLADGEFSRSPVFESITIDKWYEYIPMVQKMAIRYFGFGPEVYLKLMAGQGLEDFAYSLAGQVSGIRFGSFTVYWDYEYSQRKTWYENNYQYNQLLLTGTAGDDNVNLRESYFSVIHAGNGDDRISGIEALNLLNPVNVRLPYLPNGYYEVERPSEWTGMFVDGGSGNDQIIASHLNDFLVGGKGDDTLRGLGGNDRYYLSADNGHDTVYEAAGAPELNGGDDRIMLPFSVQLSDLQYSWGQSLFAVPVFIDAINYTNYQTDLVAMMPHTTLTISWSENDSVTVVLPVNAGAGDYGVDALEFADGSLLAFDRVLELAGYAPQVSASQLDNVLVSSFSMAGGAGDDYLRYTGGLQSGTDALGFDYRYGGRFNVLVGGTGSDVLIGGEAADTLIGGDGFARNSSWGPTFMGSFADQGNVFDGGGGNDVIWAAAGEDTFVYRAGDGFDTVYDPYYEFDVQSRISNGLLSDQSLLDYRQGQDTLFFADGVTAEDIEFWQSDWGMSFRLKDGTGGVYLPYRDGGDLHQLDRVVFSDGMVWQKDLPADQLSLFREVSNLAAAAAGFVETGFSDLSVVELERPVLPELLAVS